MAKLIAPLFLLLLLLITFRSQAQDSIAHPIAVSAGYHRGFLIAHRPMVVPLQKNTINGIEITFVMQPDGSKEWHHIYGFPEMGLSLSLWDLGNPEQLGNSVTLIPYLDFPVTKGKRSSFDIKFGWGVGYVQKNFDADNNHKNVAVGSRFNSSLILQPHYKINLSERVSVNAGISMTHYSNGSVSTPNLGLNIASLTAGASWQLGTPVQKRTFNLPEFQKNNRYTFFGSVSSKQIYPANGKNFIAATLSANRAWQISRKSAFGVGADLFYDHSIYQRADVKEIEINNSLETLRGGIHGSYELVVGDVSIILNMGGYLYSKINDGLFYHRIGIRYRINEKIFACLNIKSHWGKADFMEVGVGFRIDRKRSVKNE